MKYHDEISNTNNNNRRSVANVPEWQLGEVSSQAKAGSVGVTDLPDQLLQCVAKYLPRPSQAIFAVALRAPSSSWCNNGTACPTEPSEWLCESWKWDVLDFEEIDNHLAPKLDDNDVGAILMSMDANNRLERLKLAGLVNISGKGLEPLRGSTTLKQIDLSLVGKRGIDVPKNTKISEEIVAPILMSVVTGDESSLRQLQLPKKWCGYRNRGADMNQLIQQCNSMLHKRSFGCAGGTHETGECFGTDGDDWYDAYARQRFTCYECLDNICDDPAVEVSVRFCEGCRKSYCQVCVPRDSGCCTIFDKIQ